MANTQTMTYQPIHLLSTTNSCNNRTAKNPTVHIIFISALHFYLTDSQSNDELLVRITGLKQCMILLLANRKIFTFCRFHLAISDINTPNSVTKINPCVTAHGVIRWWQQHSLSDLWHQVCMTDSTERNTVPIFFVPLEKKQKTHVGMSEWSKIHIAAPICHSAVTDYFSCAAKQHALRFLTSVFIKATSQKMSLCLLPAETRDTLCCCFNHWLLWIQKKKRGKAKNKVCWFFMKNLRNIKHQTIYRTCGVKSRKRFHTSLCADQLAGMEVRHKIL